MTRDSTMATQARRFSVAPMMERTDRHERVFLRLLTRRALLYTEMVPSAAIVRGRRLDLLAYDPIERPLALQVGGADPAELAECARIAFDLGYDEINLNVGCPSERVQHARFGACLMAEPELVAACVRAMGDAAAMPVTVKCRIGIDERDSFAELYAFARRMGDAGCTALVVHARKAWLKGLSPRENREVPPLRVEMVYRLKETLPGLPIVLNGGIADLATALRHLGRVDGVMIGRAAYENPYILADVDARLFGAAIPAASREVVVKALLPYAAAQRARGVPVHRITRHILGLFNGQAGARAWRRSLSEMGRRPDAGPEVILRALDQVHAAAAERTAA